MKRSPSLKRPLIVYPLVFHFFTLLASFAILIAVAIRIDSGGPYTDERIVPVMAQAVKREAMGRLSVVMTPELANLRATAPDLWFVAEDDAGARVAFGSVPEHYASLLGRLSDLSYAQLRDRAAPHDLAAVIRRETTEIGTLTILGHGELSELSFIMVFATNTIILPIFVLLTLTSLSVTPWIVRRSLSGVSRIAREAEGIDADSRGLCRDLASLGAEPASRRLLKRQQAAGARSAPGSRQDAYGVSTLSGSGRGRSVARAPDRI